MHASTFAAAALALIASASSAVAVPKPIIARADAECDPPAGKAGILSPAAGTTLTPGEPFSFSFCSPTYFKTSSRELLIGFENGDASSSTLANLIKVNVSASGYPAKYTQDLSFGPYDAHAGDGKLVVYEVQNGYYNAYNFVKFTQSVKIAEQSNDA